LRELKRLLGKKTIEPEILKKALAESIRPAAASLQEGRASPRVRP
jgi:hypothetical protein